MTIAEITKKMVEFYRGNLHDINHFLKVHAYAKLIGECERLDARTLETLEVAAIVHDIACPVCRAKYGGANGKYQEIEGESLSREFLVGSGLSEQTIDRVAFLVAHHHTPEAVDGADYQILLEADYLVNADEGGAPRVNIESTLEKLFRTETGSALLKNIYLRV